MRPEATHFTIDFSPFFVVSILGLIACVTALIVVLAKSRKFAHRTAVLVLILILVAFFAAFLFLPLVDVVTTISSGAGDSE